MLSVRLRATVHTLLVPGFLIAYLPWKLRHFEAAGSLSPAIAWLLGLTGAAMCVAGVALLVSSASYLLRRGDGTPFPLDPTRRMVVAGPYAHIQHPMLVGGLIALVGQAVWCTSTAVMTYTVLVRGRGCRLPALDRRAGIAPAVRRGLRGLSNGDPALDPLPHLPASVGITRERVGLRCVWFSRP